MRREAAVVALRSMRRLSAHAARARHQGDGMSDPLAPIPRLALTREEAATSIGMSLDSFERHVQPTLRLVRLGRMRLVPISELERWLEQNARRTLDDVA
jgi:hypothetical protein